VRSGQAVRITAKSPILTVIDLLRFGCWPWRSSAVFSDARWWWRCLRRISAGSALR